LEEKLSERLRGSRLRVVVGWFEGLKQDWEMLSYTVWVAEHHY